MPAAQSQYKTTNYMVPSNGQTHAVGYQGTLSATPLLVDWRQFAIDNELFQPQGVYIDNTAGTVPLVVTILPINFKVTCPAGLTLEASFPAPNGQTATITGDPNNSATVIFVDYPVLPSGNATNVLNTVNVNLNSVSAGVRVPTDGNPLAAGNTLPYRTQEYVPAAEAGHIQITGAATTGNYQPVTAQQNLRKIILTLSGNATLAAAGQVTVTLTLNGVTIFTAIMYVGATVPANSPSFEEFSNLDFGMIGLPAGAGNLTATISTALASGSLDINAYFTPQ